MHALPVGGQDPQGLKQPVGADDTRSPAPQVPGFVVPVIQASGMTGASPLKGLRVAVTRPADGPDVLAGALEARGATAVAAPLVRITSPADGAPLSAALERLGTYDWVVFTSANAVRAVGPGLAPPAARIAAVGPATAEAIAGILGWRVHAMPGEFTGRAVTAAMLRQGPLDGARVLWPRAEAAREELREQLAAAGAHLDAPVAYRTVQLPQNAARLAGMIETGAVDVVTLTSPSAARCLADAVASTGRAVIAVIGPSTAEAARASGLPVHVEPAAHTIPDMVEALETYLRAVAP
jgi:uroporphyrinogen-III synthase